MFPGKKPVQQPSSSVDELVQRAQEIKNIQKQTNEYSPCPECKVPGPASTKHACAICGKLGCDTCMTYDPMEDKYYCEQCWNTKD